MFIFLLAMSVGSHDSFMEENCQLVFAAIKNDVWNGSTLGLLVANRDLLEKVDEQTV